MKILYTGFEPFGGESTNPSFEAVSLLPEVIAGASVVRRQIPTLFTQGAEAVLSAIRLEQPDFVICCGQAGKRCLITPEFVAINYRHARLPDNAGLQPREEAILADGPAAYFTKLPVHAIVQRCQQEGIPAQVSYTAGTYVCNEVMYRLLHGIATEFPGVVGGFLHVPYSTDQVAGKGEDLPSMALPLLVKALQIAGEVTIREAGRQEGTGSNR